MAEKTETNPKGAGRPRNNKVYKGLTINGTEEELNQLRDLAHLERKTVSRYVLDMIGVKNMEKKNWFVANDNGDIVGHDMSEMKAKDLASQLQEKEPNEGWEALNSDEED